MQDSIFSMLIEGSKVKKEKKNVKCFQQRDDLNSWARVTII